MKLHRMMRTISPGHPRVLAGEVVEFTDGTCVLRWVAHIPKGNGPGGYGNMPSSTCLYGSLEEMRQLHSHGNRTIIEPVAGTGTVNLVCSEPCCLKYTCPTCGVPMDRNDPQCLKCYAKHLEGIDGD